MQACSGTVPVLCSRVVFRPSTNGIDLPQLETIQVGDNSFKNVEELNLTALNELKSVEVGQSCFTEKGGALNVKNCTKLTSLSTGAHSFAQYKVLAIEGTPALERIEIGSEAFKNVGELELIGLSALKRVRVGDGCFLQNNGHFYVQNCPLLTELSVGAGSFRSYAACAIENVNALKTIGISDGAFSNANKLSLVKLDGLETVTIGRRSFSARDGQFTLRGCPSLTRVTIGDEAFSKYSQIAVIRVDALKTIEIGSKCFQNVKELTLVELERLESVVVGDNSFWKNGYSNSPDGRFQLKNCPALKTLRMGSNAFKDYNEWIVDGVNALEGIEINENGFYSVQSFDLKSGRGTSGLRVDLPALKSVKFGNNAFQECSRVAFDSDGLSPS